jgi:hypothetical protein
MALHLHTDEQMSHAIVCSAVRCGSSVQTVLTFPDMHLAGVVSHIEVGGSIGAIPVDCGTVESRCSSLLCVVVAQAGSLPLGGYLQVDSRLPFHHSHSFDLQAFFFAPRAAQVILHAIV